MSHFANMTKYASDETIYFTTYIQIKCFSLLKNTVGFIKKENYVLKAEQKQKKTVYYINAYDIFT